MYIPDNIVLRFEEKRIRVYAADDGADTLTPLRVRRVTIDCEEMSVLSATVVYGTYIRTVGEPEPQSAMIEYPAHHVTVEVAQPVQQAKE